MKQVFPIVPAGGGSLVFLGVLGVFLFGLFLVFLYMAHSARGTRFEVSPEGLRIRGDIYGRAIPLSEIEMSRVKPVDLALQTEYRPRWKTNGVGLPGYKAGWFKLANGEKGLMFVTDQSRVVYVPTIRGYSVLLSVAEPEQFAAALRNAGR